MKKSIFVLIMTAFIITGNFLFAQDSVKGGYTKCIVYRYEYKDGKIDSNSKEIYHTYKYNEYGFKMEEETYQIKLDRKYSLSYLNKYHYDINNNIIENVETNYNTSDTIKIKYKYNTNNKLVENVKESLYPRINYKIIYNYDSKGNNISTYFYDDKDSLNQWIFLDYDSLNRKVEFSQYSKYQSLECNEYYTYNEKGNLIEKKLVSYIPYCVGFITCYINENNNLIEVNSYQAPEPDISDNSSCEWHFNGISYEQHFFGFTRMLYLHQQTFKYDMFNNIIEELKFFGEGASIPNNKYFYDKYNNLIKYMNGTTDGIYCEFDYIYSK